MKFTKMQGIGNDYVYVNCFKEKVDSPTELAIKVSERHFGIGSDALVMWQMCVWICIISMVQEARCVVMA